MAGLVGADYSFAVGEFFLKEWCSLAFASSTEGLLDGDIYFAGAILTFRRPLPLNSFL